MSEGFAIPLDWDDMFPGGGAARSSSGGGQAGDSPWQALEVNLKLPDLWQQEAVRALQAGQDVVVHAPTGAGKTFIFELFVENGLKGQAIYTVPTRALANDKLAEWRARGWDVGIATGDVAENLDAKVIVATLETQKSRFLERRGPALLVVDEYQLIGDDSRGVNYELALAMAPKGTQLLLLSGSVGNPHDVAEWLRRLGREVALVRTHDRPVPLQEVALESLPMRLPRHLQGYWVRAVAAALMADLGPILIFAPHRKSCEKIAAQLAAGLPQPNPLELSREQEHACGGTLAQMLKSRVAFHHSGLGYGVRAGLIEPLARTGQLRVVVSTMGLAAGINFSMRSVMVAERSYFHHNFECQVAPDELLQMFGRAGRRGLDENGYVLVMPDRPRLSDAHELRLVRSTQLDWGSLLGVMNAAAQRGEDPVLAAHQLNQSLFTKSPPLLGIERAAQGALHPCGLCVDAERARLARPNKEEFLNSRNEWEPLPAKPRQVTLGELWVRDGEGESAAWRRALMTPAVMDTLGDGALCKIRQERGWSYGRQIALASRVTANGPERGGVRISKWLAAKLAELPAGTLPRLPQARVWREDLLEKVIIPNLPVFFKQGVVHETFWRENTLIAIINFSHLPRTAYVDSHGRALAEPPVRKSYAPICVNCRERIVCEVAPTQETPALAWRRLGLIDKQGAPTRRGVITSFFNKGEGMAVAAALEDERYPIDELIYDLANLRAGHRFAGDDSHYGGRLGVRCQEVYDRASHAGYLELGVPVQYGAGASEVMHEMVERGKPASRLITEMLRTGDIERAALEWQSLLRQIRHAPDYPWDRWQALKTAAAEKLATLESAGFGQNHARFALGNFPPLTPAQQRGKVDHRLRMR
jgi:superfamily II DNA/RNA helicase